VEGVKRNSQSYLSFELLCHFCWKWAYVYNIGSN